MRHSETIKSEIHESGRGDGGFTPLDTDYWKAYVLENQKLLLEVLLDIRHILIGDDSSRYEEKE